MTDPSVEEPTDERATVEYARASPGQAAGAVLQMGGVLLVALVCAVAGWPTSALPRLLLWSGLLVAGLVALLIATVRLGRTEHDRLAARPSHELVSGWLQFNEEHRSVDQLELVRELYYDGRNSRAREARFAILMAFAAVIAAAGVAADSTAVVIGAMLIAPLITPMMGMALGLTMGWETKLIKATTMVVLGVGIAVGVGALMPSLITTSIDVASNAQVVSRTSPTLIDLVIAIAAGAAGAYALARPDVSSSLPGVAVAIALVPPLSVVGILLQASEWRLATGAGLLFLTNMVAILVTGGLVFLVTGVAPLRRLNESQHRMKVVFVSVAMTALLVAGALAANGAAIATDALKTEEVRSATLAWLADSEFELVSLDLRDTAATVVLAGAGEPPNAQTLATDLEKTVGRSIELNLQWIPRNRVLVSSD